MHCGVGSGKSHCIGVIAFDFIRNNPEVRGFIGANTYSQLTKSTLDKIFKVWESDLGLVKGRHYVVDHIPPDNFRKFGPMLKSYENTISFNNGALIFTASLDNYKVIDGTEFGWACLDETKDTKEEAVKEVIVARLRQVGMFIDNRGLIWKEEKLIEKVNNQLAQVEIDDNGVKWYVVNGKRLQGFNPLYIFTSPAKTKWLMKMFELEKYTDEIEASIYKKDDYFRKRDGDRLVVIASTYHNEKNLSPGYIDRLINDVGRDKNRVAMLVYGSPFAKTGGEFYSQFSRVTHVKRFEPWPNEPVHLSFDFNLVPYITCVCYQVKYIDKKYHVRAFREFCLSNPKNNSESLANEIKNSMYDLLKNGLYIYGDYSGKTDNTVSAEVRNNFEMIEKVLYQYLHNGSNRVVRNALHTKRRDFMNKVFSGGFSNIEYLIEEKCIELTNDLEFLKQHAVSGGKLKSKVTKDGRTYEEFGHTSDAQDYFFCSMFDNYFNA
jgi:hypothetical protein